MPKAKIIDLCREGNAFAIIGIAGSAMLDVGCTAYEVGEMKRIALHADSFSDFLETIVQYAPVQFIGRRVGTRSPVPSHSSSRAA